jgi:hypothetical protein
LDDDRFLIYRRMDSVTLDEPNYERIIFNRNKKTVTADLIAYDATGKEVTVERGIMSAEDDQGTMHN